MYESLRTRLTCSIVGVFAVVMLVSAACGREGDENENVGGTGGYAPYGGAGGQYIGGAGGTAGGTIPPPTGGTSGGPDTGGMGQAGAAGTPVAGVGGSVPVDGGPPPPAGMGGTTGGMGGTTGGTGGTIGGTGGAMGGTGGTGGTTGGTGGGELPPINDYGAMGPCAPTTSVPGTGPTGLYTMFRPQNLGTEIPRHPVASWGNGMGTVPSMYDPLLSTIASHCFVIIASDNSNVTPQLVRDGLDWLIAQNDAAGEFQGKLDPARAVTIGYSLGGRAAVDAGSHPNVIATISWHGLQGAAENLSGPLLLFTSTSDGFVTKSGYVQPCYDRSSNVPTIMATLEVPGAPADFMGHLIPLGDAGEERAPGVAWLRYWVFGDQDARNYFYGNDCILCQTPWTDIQRKNHNW